MTVVLRIHSFKVDPSGFGCKGMMFLGESGQGSQQPVYYVIWQACTLIWTGYSSELFVGT